MTTREYSEHQKNVIEFLRELEALTKKYKLVISGCGCCDSPSTYGLKEEDENKIYSSDGEGNNIEFTDKSKVPTYYLHSQIKL